MDIQKELKKFLERTGMTQTELSKRSGVHPVMVNRYLHGKSKPHFNSFQKLWPLLNEDQDKPT